jgi:threonine dehydrogenase-like Zn-dependent dehydrogenase
LKAIYFKDKKIEIINTPKAVIKQNEVLVKIILAGICNTDIELFNGYYGFEGIAGHEFVGIVEKSPENPGLIGKMVVGDINCGCGECSLCEKGDPRHCKNRSVIGIINHQGAFAEYLNVPLENIHIVDESISPFEAVFVEPLAAALEPAKQIEINAEYKIAVLGDGKLGLLSALSLKYYNPGLLLIGKHEEKLAIAEKQGVKTFLTDSKRESRSLKDELGEFDIIIEATGRPDGINYALDLIKPEGTIIVKTTSHELSSIDLAKLVVDEITLTGSRCGDFNLALRFLKEKRLDVLPMIENIFHFEDFHEAFKLARTPGKLKVIVSFDKNPG